MEISRIFGKSLKSTNEKLASTLNQGPPKKWVWTISGGPLLGETHLPILYPLEPMGLPGGLVLRILTIAGPPSPMESGRWGLGPLGWLRNSQFRQAMPEDWLFSFQRPPFSDTA